jgi:hypothetical protein
MFILLSRIRIVNNITPFLLLSFYFGLCFIVDPKGLTDSARIQSDFIDLANSDISFTQNISNFYNEGGSVDVYLPTTSWIISRFTYDSKWLFAFLALVFGYFWFSSILLVRRLVEKKLDFSILLVFILFVLINPIWQINGARMWTAIQIFFYGLLIIHIEKRSIGYLYLIFSFFVHFTLIIPFLVYTTYHIFPIKNLFFFFFLYLSTFFIGEFDLTIIQDNFNFLPSFLQSRKVYVNDAYLESLKNGPIYLSAYLKTYYIIYKYIIIVILSWVFYQSYSANSINNIVFNKLLLITLVFASFSNLASLFPSGGRFQILSNLLILSVFFWQISHRKKIFSNLFIKYIFNISILFLIVVNVRIGLDFVGIMFFIGNPVLNIFLIDNTPIIDYVKYFL